jgi:cytochrome b561
MRLWNSETSWGWPQRLLHWTVAALVLWQLGLGVWMVNLVEDQLDRFAWTQLHKSWGFVVFALALVRLGWRWANPAVPREPADLRPWERRAARASHFALYALLLWLPLSGWLMSAASPVQDLLAMENTVFGWFALPDPFVPGVRWISDAFWWGHTLAALALAGLLAIHAGAALRHHFVLRDDVLRRMSWGR